MPCSHLEDRSAIDLFGDVCREQEARRLLEVRYFDDQRVLFPDTTIDVADVAGCVEGLAELAIWRSAEARRGNRGRRKAGPDIDTGSIREAANDEAVALADQLADEARFLALDFMDNIHAREYLEPHVRATTIASGDHDQIDPSAHVS